MSRDEKLFTMTVAKAFGEQNSDGVYTRMVIKGVASNTRKDKEDHQVTIEGLESIKKAIEDGLVDEDGEWSFIPLRSGHREEWEDKLGDITSAEIDDQQNLWIVAELDVDNSKSRDLYVKVSKGNANGRKPELGLSVKGKATKYRFGVDENQAKVTYLERLSIEEISVTSKPKNPTPYPLAIYKSLIEQAKEEGTDMTVETLNPIVEDAKSDPITQAIEKSQAAKIEAANEAEVVAQEVDSSTAAAPASNNDAPAEETAVEGVAADTTATPAGYVEHPQTHHDDSAVVAEEVTTPPADNSAVQQTLDRVVSALDALRADVDALRASQQVQKAEEDSHADPVTLANEDIETRVSVAVAKAFETLGLKTLVTDMAVIKSSVSNLENMPSDKSISVSKAKVEDDPNDPIARVRSLRERGLDPIAAAVTAADEFNKKNG